MPGGWRIPFFLAWVWWYAGANATNPKFLAHVEPYLQSLDIKSYSIMGFCLVRFFVGRYYLKKKEKRDINPKGSGREQ